MAIPPQFIVPILAGIASAAPAAVGTIQQGRAAEAQSKSEQDILNFNASVKIKEAEAEREAARDAARRFTERGERLKGAQRTAFARGGVLAPEGTPALLLEEQAQILEADKIKILEQGALAAGFRESEAFGLRFQGVSARARGRNIRTGTRLQTAGTLLTGIGTAARAGR